MGVHFGVLNLESDAGTLKATHMHPGVSATVKGTQMNCNGLNLELIYCGGGTQR